MYKPQKLESGKWAYLGYIISEINKKHYQIKTEGGSILDVYPNSKPLAFCKSKIDSWVN